MPPNAERSVSAPRPSFAIARHFEQTRIVQAAIAPSAELGDQYFEELAQRWQLHSTETVIGRNASTKKLLVPFVLNPEALAADGNDVVLLDLTLIPSAQSGPHDRNSMLNSCELVMVLVDVATPNIAAANDLEQLARTNPHCCVLVVATFQQLSGTPSMRTLQSQFDRSPVDTHFLPLQQDSRLSILTLARHLEAISLELAQEAPRQSAPSQPAGGEVTDQLMSALANFDRNFTADATDTLEPTKPPHDEVGAATIKRKGRLRSAFGR